VYNIENCHLGYIMHKEKWLYVLTGLICPFIELDFTFLEKTNDKLKGLNKKLQNIVVNKRKIEISRVFVIEDRKKKSCCLNGNFNPRYLLKIEDGIRDDDFAQDLVDTVMLSVAIKNEMYLDDNPLAIPVESSLYKDGTIKIESLIGSRGINSQEYYALGEGIGLPKEILDYIWQTVPVIFENQYITDAVSFYLESIKSTWICDEDIDEIRLDGFDMSPSPFDKASIETSYQNAFKAIEAIIGEPPDDLVKLKNKLEQAGINPENLVGLYELNSNDKKLIEKIVDMQKIRNKKAAHGKTLKAGRNIGYYELKDKQALSRYIILSHIQSKMNE
jgi:hypothetical protein